MRDGFTDQWWIPPKSTRCATEPDMAFDYTKRSKGCLRDWFQAPDEHAIVFIVVTRVIEWRSQRDLNP